MSGIEKEKDESAGKRKAMRFTVIAVLRVNVKKVKRKFGLGGRRNNLSVPGIQH